MNGRRMMETGRIEKGQKVLGRGDDKKKGNRKRRKSRRVDEGDKDDERKQKTNVEEKEVDRMEQEDVNWEIEKENFWGKMMKR